MGDQIYTRSDNGQGPWTGTQGIVMRQKINPGSVTGGLVSAQIELTAGGDTVVSGLFIGYLGGGSVDYAAAPTQITVGGSTQFEVPGDGSVVLTDPFTFDFSDPRPAIVGIAFLHDVTTCAPMTYNSANGDHVWLCNSGEQWAGQMGSYPVWFDADRLLIGHMQLSDGPAPVVGMKVSEGRVFSVMTIASAEVRASEGRTFGIINFPTPEIRISQERHLVTVKRDSDIDISQARTFAVVAGRVQNPHVRAWTFTLDGHDFYVLRLGDGSTILYDTASKQWVDWDSLDSGAWRPNCGTNWVGAQALGHTKGSDVVAGDDTFGLLWFLDPLLPYDQSPDLSRLRTELPFTRVVTGQTLASGRQQIPCYAVFLDGDNYGLSGTEFTPGIVLETSDDQGRTFDTHDTLTVDLSNNQQPDTWYSLGQIGSPGRIFRITDTGVYTRIDSLEMNDDAG